MEQWHRRALQEGGGDRAQLKSAYLHQQGPRRAAKERLTPTVPCVQGGYAEHDTEATQNCHLGAHTPVVVRGKEAHSMVAFFNLPGSCSSMRSVALSLPKLIKYRRQRLTWLCSADAAFEVASILLCSICAFRAVNQCCISQSIDCLTAALAGLPVSPSCAQLSM